MGQFHGIYIFPTQALTRDALLAHLPLSERFFRGITFSRIVELDHFYCEDYHLTISTGADTNLQLYLRLYLHVDDHQRVVFYDAGEFGHPAHDFFEEHFTPLADWLHAGVPAEAYFFTGMLLEYQDYYGNPVEPDAAQAYDFIRRGGGEHKIFH